MNGATRTGGWTVSGPPMALALGLTLVFVAERLLGAGAELHPWFAGIGGALVLSAALLRVREHVRSPPAARPAVRAALMGYLAVALGLAIYAFAPEAPSPLVQVAWPLLVAAGAAVAFAADGCRVGLARPERVEVRRVRAAALGSLSLVLAIAWVGALNVLAAQGDVLWEWSENVRLHPSKATLQLANALPEEATLTVFLPPASEVLHRVRPYFEEVAASPKITLEIYDHAIEPARAEALGARKNGVAFVSQGEERRRISLGTDWEKARRKLKNLDRDVQGALLKVTRTRQTLYLTVGHGEQGSRVKGDPRPGMGTLKKALRQRNVTVRNLGLKEGLGQAIPDDAAAVALIGPSQPLLPEEVAALIAYYRAGGSLLIMVEAGVDAGLGPLLEAVGVTVDEGVVAHDRYHVRRDGGPSDRVVLVTNRYGSHPAVENVRAAAAQSAVLAVRAGGVRAAGDGPARVTPLVKTMPESFLDRDGDRVRGEAEVTEPEALVVAASLGATPNEGRAVVAGDPDIFADGVVNNVANLQLLLDSWLWLAREDAVELRVSAPIVDPPIRHTRDQDVLWFWSTVVGAPLLVLLGGLGFVRRRRRRS